MMSHLARLPRLALIVAGLAIAFGLWQLGQGLYIRAKAATAQVLLQGAWDETLRKGEGQKAWPWADTHPVAVLEAPRLGTRQIVLQGASGEAMAFGPGHLDGTPAPGNAGWSVLSSHRDTHFRYLKKLVSGDRLHVTTPDGELHQFRVTGTRVVHWKSSGIDPHGPGRGIALVTCYPFDAVRQGPLRYVVLAEAETPAT